MKCYNKYQQEIKYHNPEYLIGVCMIMLIPHFIQRSEKEMYEIAYTRDFTLTPHHIKIRHPLGIKNNKTKKKKFGSERAQMKNESVFIHNAPQHAPNPYAPFKELDQLRPSEVRSDAFWPHPRKKYVAASELKHREDSIGFFTNSRLGVKGFDRCLTGVFDSFGIKYTGTKYDLRYMGIGLLYRANFSRAAIAARTGQELQIVDGYLDKIMKYESFNDTQAQLHAFITQTNKNYESDMQQRLSLPPPLPSNNNLKYGLECDAKPMNHSNSLGLNQLSSDNRVNLMNTAQRPNTDHSAIRNKMNALYKKHQMNAQNMRLKNGMNNYINLRSNVHAQNRMNAVDNSGALRSNMHAQNRVDAVNNYGALCSNMHAQNCVDAVNKSGALCSNVHAQNDKNAQKYPNVVMQSMHATTLNLGGFPTIANNNIQNTMDNMRENGIGDALSSDPAEIECVVSDIKNKAKKTVLIKKESVIKMERNIGEDEDCYITQVDYTKKKVPDGQSDVKLEQIVKETVSNYLRGAMSNKLMQEDDGWIICYDCRQPKKFGRLDKFNGSWFCNQCWDLYDAQF